MKTRGTLGRREFLARTTEALATVSVCARMATAGAQAASPAPAAEALPVRTLGKTG